MSEIKGQLLGLLLVLGVFGAISAILVNSFQSAAEYASKNMQNEIPTATVSSGAKGFQDAVVELA